MVRLETNFEKFDPKSFYNLTKAVFPPKMKLIAQRTPKNSKDNPGENLVLDFFRGDSLLVRFLGKSL